MARLSENEAGQSVYTNMKIITFRQENSAFVVPCFPYEGRVPSIAACRAYAKEHGMPVVIEAHNSALLTTGPIEERRAKGSAALARLEKAGYKVIRL